MSRAGQGVAPQLAAINSVAHDTGLAAVQCFAKLEWRREYFIRPAAESHTAVAATSPVLVDSR